MAWHARWQVPADVVGRWVELNGQDVGRGWLADAQGLADRRRSSSRSALAAGATPLRKRDAHHGASRERAGLRRCTRPGSATGHQTPAWRRSRGCRKAAQRPRRADLTRRGRSTVLHRLLRSPTTLGRRARRPIALLLPTRGGVPAAVQLPAGRKVRASPTLRQRWESTTRAHPREVAASDPQQPTERPRSCHHR